MGVRLKSTVRWYLVSAMDGDTEKKTGLPTMYDSTEMLATDGLKPESSSATSICA